MALQTDLNVSPYYDDFDATKSYHRILFQPGVAVQARELNQLQSILQNQIEKFGDNIFKRGTIIEGCNVVLHNNLPYIKINDIETDGSPVNVDQYNNLYVKNVANVSAFIVKTAVGYESRSPNLNTLFVKYNNSGTTGNTSVFTAGETLTVFDPSYPIFHMKVNDGSTGFSNSDTVAVISAIAVQNSTGGSAFAGGAFNVNDVIQNGVANATIIEANNTANASALILKIKPLAIDLQTANTVKWRFTAGETIRNATNTSVSANIAGTVGAGATGSLTTDSLGKIVSIAVTNLGTGYYIQPHVTASITSNGATTTAAINQLSITGQNYLTNITAANSAQLAIGFGYGMSVNEGTIYQKGFFSRVEPQLTIVNKYSNTGFTKSVGFYTSEAIINSNQDATLLDNATGTFNYAAPGANRLKLSPVLTVLDKVDADANTDFLPIVEFADGSAYKQTKQTVYNVLGDEMAKRTYEESGNYVLDQFNLTTKDSTTFTETPSVFKIYIDPGLAYINGYRTETVASYTANIAKGVDTVSNVETSIKIGYGNFIRVKELAGVFEFNIGAQIDLYNIAAGFLTSTPTASIAPPAGGTKIGSARIRSLVHDSGEPGAAGSVYRMYLFDIVMSTGKNFADIRSVYYSGSTKGIADCLLNAGGLTTILNDSADSSLLFKTVNAVKYANNITYTYRTMNQTEQANSTGYIDLNVGAGEYFPYNAGGVLNDTQERDILVIPRANYQATANAPGNVSTSSASVTVTGISGTTFTSSFKTGDYVKIANSTASIVKQVWQVLSDTSMNMYSAVGATFPFANVVLYLPNNVPISFGRRSERTVTVAANGQQLTISLANSFATPAGVPSSANVTVVYNVTANNTSTGSKVSHRGIYTRIRIANNAAATPGPWTLGVADAFRLKNVYQANGASVAKTFNANTGVVGSFVSIPNNPFANGDSLIYTTGTGGTILSGLANNTTYYAVLANSSGSKFASTRNGSALTIAASSISETHTFTGSPLYFAPDTYGVADITNDFYIDNNQTEDYLDISYLYKKPKRLATSVNDVYLIKYDAFTSGTGVKTVSSYNVNDAANLATLSTGSEVHTMEIPEATGISGKYYDLRDQFDFRPVSSNTIPLITELSNTSIVNPTEPSDAARFSAVEQKFPLPNSDLTANISFYVGRNDRVVLDRNGRFTTLKGVPGALNAFPDEPKDSITIQYLTIPPYPSLPASLSAEMVEIVDTRVANEKYGRRKDNFRVTTPLDKNQQARIQIKNYQMNDIASLEKRIKDLEYYVSFTLVEAITNSKFIPSSASNAIDRFKFGFFVDPFTDLSFCDTKSPEFKATVKDNTLGTKSFEHIFQLVPESGTSESILTMPYVEYTLISQNDATDGAIEVVQPQPTGYTGSNPTGYTGSNPTGYTGSTGPTPTDVTVPVVTQTMAEVTEQQKTFANQPENGSVYEDFFYVFSSLSGPAELYAIYRDNYMAFEISQGTAAAGPYATTITSASAQAIGSAAYASKGITGLNAQFSDGVAESIDILNMKSVYAAGIPYIEDSQKILWTHDPSLGQYVRVRVYKGGRHGASRGKAGSYGFKMFYPTDTVTTRTVTTTNPTNFQYLGTVYDVIPKTFTLAFTLGYFDLTSNNMDAYIADAQKFVISITGLKPKTFHQFIFDNVDKTDKCVQKVTSGTNSGSGLYSDEYGTLTFDFYYDAGITEATSDLTQQNKLAAAVAGPKAFVVQSYGDGNSKAAGSIEMKYYSDLTDALTGSYTGLNVTQTTTVGDTKTNDYNYNTGTLPDYTTNTKTDTNVQTVDFIGDGNIFGNRQDFTLNKIKID